MTSIEMENRIAALEAFVADVVRTQTFTAYGRTPTENESLRTPLGNCGAVLLGLPEYKTTAGLDASLDTVS